MKFTDEDGETTEENLELKIEAAPVILIPGIFDNAAHTFGSTKNSGVWRGLLNAGFSKEYIDVWEYDRSKSSEELAGRDYDNGLFGVLTAMFNRYAEKGIACTKADIVAHGFEKLLTKSVKNSILLKIFSFARDMPAYMRVLDFCSEQKQMI